MHELSVAQSLTDFVCDQISGSEAQGHVTRVHVRLGAMSGITAHALKTAFSEAVVGTQLQYASLEIESLDLVVWCPRCHQEQLVTDGRLRCPLCQTRTPHVVQGKELEISSIEVQSDVPAANPSGSSADSQKE